MMGPGIALTLALGGWRAAILSRSEKNASQALEKARAQARLLADQDLVDCALAEQAAQLLSASTDFDNAIGSAGLVIESGPEDMIFKQDLFARMDALAGAETLLASNTSGLSITAVAERYWARTMRSPTGELCFAAHARNAPDEMRALADQISIRLTDRPATSQLRQLLARKPGEPRSAR